MKALIVYYSETGNTKKLAGLIGEELHQKGWAVDERRLQAKNEARSFLGKCLRAFFRMKAKLEQTFFVVSPYELICFGCPVWAGEPAPALRTYLDQCVGLMGKKIVIFITYGSGLWKNHCTNYMVKMVGKKGAKEILTLSIASLDLDNLEKVKEEIKKVLA